MGALLFGVAIYLFMNLGAFGITAMVIWDTGSDKIENFTGLIRRSPWLAVPMVMCLMSLIGMPIFAGFIAKWWVLVALGNAAAGFAWFLAVVLVLNTLFSLYYYVRIIVQMTLMDDGRPEVRSPLGGLALANGCALMLLLLFFFANPLKQATDRFAKNLVMPQPTVQNDSVAAAGQEPAP